MKTPLKTARPVEILLVEDSATDADLTLREFQKGRCGNDVYHVKDGVEALAYLRREDGYRDAPRPDVILLDLHLPRMDGWELLGEIRGDASLATLFVVALTTSDDDREMMESRDPRADACLVKPVDLKKFFEVVKASPQFGLQFLALQDKG